MLFSNKKLSYIIFIINMNYHLRRIHVKIYKKKSYFSFVNFYNNYSCNKILQNELTLDNAQPQR